MFQDKGKCDDFSKSAATRGVRCRARRLRNVGQARDGRYSELGARSGHHGCSHSDALPGAKRPSADHHFCREYLFNDLHVATRQQQHSRRSGALVFGSARRRMGKVAMLLALVGRRRERVPEACTHHQAG